MREILKDLRAHRLVAVDTNVCVYVLQAAPRWVALATDVMSLPAIGSDLFIPDIVRLELLVGPYRTGDFDERESVQGLLDRGRRIEIDDDVIEMAAQLRAMTRMRTPDALVAACAAVARCSAIVGNDTVFKDLNAMKGMTLIAAGQPALIPQYFHLDDYVERA